MGLDSPYLQMCWTWFRVFCFETV